MVLHRNEVMVRKLFVGKQLICIQTEIVFKYLVTENERFVGLKKAMPFLFPFFPVMYRHINVGPGLWTQKRLYYFVPG